ncbi:MAG TPA: hypothetical protein VIF61_07060 [Methylocystis sp.]|jgi:hypothetical protein
MDMKSLLGDKEENLRELRRYKDAQAKGTAAVLGVGLPIIALLYAYTTYDRAVHYLPVEARVTQAETQCRYNPTKKNGRLTLLEIMPCDKAQEYVHADPGSSMTKYFIVFVDYQSPADHKPYSQRMSLPAANYQSEIGPGAVVEILASKTEPYTVRY